MACRYVSVLRRVLQFGIFIRLVMVSNFDQKAEWGIFLHVALIFSEILAARKVKKKENRFLHMLLPSLSGPFPL